jgi:hypothetical protein
MNKLFICSILIFTGLSLEAQNFFLVDKEAKPVAFQPLAGASHKIGLE